MGGQRDELIERSSPSVVEPHVGMAFAGVDVGHVEGTGEL